MIGAFSCIYKTPCGWCTKWDKECDSVPKNKKKKNANYVTDEQKINIGKPMNENDLRR